jgi:methylmalonyl-CoA/ethylmalonyl-CoA epimerase
MFGGLLLHTNKIRLKMTRIPGTLCLVCITNVKLVAMATPPKKNLAPSPTTTPAQSTARSSSVKPKLRKITRKQKPRRKFSRFGSSTVAQISIVVYNIEEAAENWAALLDLPVPEIYVSLPEERGETLYMGEPTPARARIAFFKMRQLYLELIEPVDGPSVWNDQLVTRGQGLHHIAIKVKGLEKRLKRYQKEGWSVIQSGKHSAGRYAYLDGTAHFGTILELLEDNQ